jgi:hypothetical protein
MVGAAIESGGSPNLKMGMTILCSTVSIQNVAAIWTASALGLVAAASPSKKAILSVPPPNSGGKGKVETVKTIVSVIVSPAIASRRTVLGSFNIAWVIVPAAINFVKSWYSRCIVIRSRLAGEQNKLRGAAADHKGRNAHWWYIGRSAN